MDFIFCASGLSLRYLSLPTFVPLQELGKWGFLFYNSVFMLPPAVLLLIVTDDVQKVRDLSVLVLMCDQRFCSSAGSRLYRFGGGDANGVVPHRPFLHLRLSAELFDGTMPAAELRTNDHLHRSNQSNGEGVAR